MELNWKRYIITFFLFFYGYLILNEKLFAQALEKTKIVIAVGGKSLLYNLPLTIAERLNYFKEEGLQVEIEDFSGGGKALQALIGGSADVVSGAFEHTIMMQVMGQQITAFVLQGRAPQIVMAVSNKTMSHYKVVTNLRGKKIGISAPGSSTNMMSNFVLAKSGLKSSDVSYIGVGVSAGAVAALRSGQIDAIVNTEPVISMLQKHNDIRIIFDTRTLKETDSVFGGPMPAATLYTHSAFIKKYPNTTQALTNAMVRALKWLQTAAPADVVKVVPENYLLGDVVLYSSAFTRTREALSPDGVLSESAAKTALHALQIFDPAFSDMKINLSQTYTNVFVRKSLMKYK